jgi:hypothetical protein
MPNLHGRKANGIVNVAQNVLFSGDVQFNSGWGTLYYVDPTNGADTNDGLTPSYGFKSLRYALTIAGAFDTIFVKPAVPDTDGGDPTATTPDTAANWTVPYTSHNLSIVGAGAGRGRNPGYLTMLRGYVGLTTPTLYVKAPYVNLENLGLRGAAACTDGAVKFSFSNAGPDWSFGSTVYNCTFWKAGAAYGGALVMDAAWYMEVLKSTFVSCYKGIVIGASNSVPVGLHIADCTWQALAAEVSACIESSGAVTNILIERTAMNHALPSGGGSNKYIVFSSASTGEWMDSQIGATATTIGTNTTLNGVGYSKIYCGTNIGLATNA